MSSVIPPNQLLQQNIVINPLQSDLNANNNRITNLAAGILSNDAVTLHQVGVGWMENPAIENLNMSNFKITNLASGSNLQDSVIVDQLLRWAENPATSNIDMQFNQITNCAAATGSNATVNFNTGQVSALEHQMRNTNTSSPVETYFTNGSQRSLVSSFDSGSNYYMRANSQTDGVSVGTNGPYAYCITNNGGFGIGTPSVEFTRINDNSNQNVNSLMSRWNTNNMLLAGGVNSGLNNNNFIPKINISAETLYYPVIRALDNSENIIGNLPARADWIGSRGELQCLSGNWYCLSQRLNQNLNKEFFCNNSWTVQIRHSLNNNPFTSFRYLFTLTDISSRASSNTNRVTMFFGGSTNSITCEIEQNAASPVESAFSTLAGSAFMNNFSTTAIYNYFLSYNHITNIFTLNIHDNSGSAIALTSGGDISRNSAAVDISVTNWQPKYVYLGRSPFTADGTMRGTYYNCNLFAKQLSQSERQLACVASRNYYDVSNQSVNLKNISSVQKQYAHVNTNGFNVQNTSISGNIFYSGDGGNALINNLTTGNETTAIDVGREWNIWNLGSNLLTFSNTDNTTLSGGNNIPGNTFAKLYQTDICSFALFNPVQTSAISGTNYLFSGVNISGIANFDSSNIVCKDLVINGANTVMPSILIQTNNSTNSMRTVTLSGVQQLTEWVWTQEGYSGNLTWLGTNFQNGGATNNRGTFFCGSTNSVSNGAVANVLAARNGNDWLNIANDAVIIGSSARNLYVSRADNNAANYANLYRDSSGRLFTSTLVPSFFGFFRTANYTQTLTSSSSQLAFTPETTTSSGGGFVLGFAAIENVATVKNVLINACLSVSTPGANTLSLFIRTFTAGDIAQQVIDTNTNIQCISLVAVVRVTIGDIITIRGSLTSSNDLTIHNLNFTVSEI